MIYLSVHHTVADYAKWRPFFDAHDTVRRANGATGVVQVYRDLNNPNDITSVIEWDSVENAEKFAQSPDLAETMRNAGVTSVPEAHFMSRGKIALGGGSVCPVARHTEPPEVGHGGRIAELGRFVGLLRSKVTFGIDVDASHTAAAWGMNLAETGRTPRF